MWRVLFLLIIFDVNANLPKGFIYLQEALPDVQQSVRYYSAENFTGRRVAGYEAPKIILTTKLGFILQNVSEDLDKDGFELVIYDAYRPQIAVDDFIKWSSSNDFSKKSHYFPHIKKADIFRRGFVASKSGHSRGSTVDLTIIKKGQKVCDIKPEKRGNLIFLNDCTEDMGMHWDFFGMESWSKSPIISEEYNKKREYLRLKMEKHGFRSYSGEWWHFALIEEAFPETYFNFYVK